MLKRPLSPAEIPARGVKQNYYPPFVNALALAPNVRTSPARERKQCSVLEILTLI
jgi:hypothetical protein